jgi:hypothetical protein
MDQALDWECFERLLLAQHHHPAQTPGVGESIDQYMPLTTLLDTGVGFAIAKVLGTSKVVPIPRWMIHPLGRQINQQAASDPAVGGG